MEEKLYKHTCAIRLLAEKPFALESRLEAKYLKELLNCLTSYSSYYVSDAF